MSSLPIVTCDRHLTPTQPANMQVITAIYLNCRPDLRDEWLTGMEVDDAMDAQVRVFRRLFWTLIINVAAFRHKSKPCGI